MSEINYNVFRQYDIRGIYPEDINEDFTYTLGLSYGSYLQEKYKLDKCVVGHDNRISSDSLNKSLLQGINESGCSTVDIGLVTTPILYFARKHLKLPGIMITASHNPKDDNGFKFSFDENCNARGEMIEEFKEFTKACNFLTGNGKNKEFNLNEVYINLLMDSLSFGEKHRRIIIDAGNGTASVFVKNIHERIPNLHVEYLYCESDGTFPNHHPDPSVEENLTVLKKKVVEQKYDFGISYDGDGDRIGLIDELGNFIPADKIMIIFVRDLMSKIYNKTILYDIKCSKALEDEIKKLGGIPLSYRTGASYTQAKVMKEDIEFGGEYSGHLYFNDRIFPNSCGIYAGLRLIEILSKTDKSVSELLAGINNYISIPETKIACDDDKKFAIVEKIKKYANDRRYNVNDIDGIRVTFPEGWALVRASNTGPNLTTRYEAIDQYDLNKIAEEFNKEIKKYLE